MNGNKIMNRKLALFVGVLMSSWGSGFCKVGGRRNGVKQERRRLQTINVVGNLGDPPPEALPLGLCWGDCDTDDDCEPGLMCYQRDDKDDVPGCEGGKKDESLTDYCIINPNAPAPTPKTPTTIPTAVPTAKPTTILTTKPTIEPTIKPTTSPLAVSTSKPTTSYLAVSTFKPSDSRTVAPSDTKTEIIILSPSIETTPKPTHKPTLRPTMRMTPKPTSVAAMVPSAIQPFGKIEYIGNEGTFYSPYPLGPCKGDCDSDADCAGGLYCYQRVANQAVPYCNGGEIEASTADFCTWDGVTIPIPELPGPVPEGFFRLKLYWEDGYRWQNETFEREWCMMWDYDGYPGTGICWKGNNTVNCDSDHTFVAKCVEGEPRMYFTFVDAPNSGSVVQKLIQTGNGRCFEREERNIWLKECDPSNTLQHWFAPNGDFDGPRFELSQINFSTQCVTNDHHPKSGEIVELHFCEAARQPDDSTSYWNKY